ncbi:hypothetical protein PybrP1_012968 [[Pythium] brassicae (nom. inval.)]|nr:hypothetical protein PybrP1_012968 [[Pythium] brassicae (nom. inval.)]
MQHSQTTIASCVLKATVSPHFGQGAGVSGDPTQRACLSGSFTGCNPSTPATRRLAHVPRQHASRPPRRRANLLPAQGRVLLSRHAPVNRAARSHLRGLRLGLVREGGTLSALHHLPEFPEHNAHEPGVLVVRDKGACAEPAEHGLLVRLSDFESCGAGHWLTHRMPGKHAERSIQTVIPSVRSYVEHPDQGDWGEVVEKLMWSINTSLDSTRKETPFFLVHGWDPKNTMSAMLTPRQYEYSNAWAKNLQVQAKQARADKQTDSWEALSEKHKTGFDVCKAVWLYLARVKPEAGPIWHGPFRILEKSDDFRYRLKTARTDYRFAPWVHVGRLKPRASFSERPTRAPPGVPDEFDLDAALPPEDSWEPNEVAGDYEVERISDVRWEKNHEVPGWIDQSQLDCGRLLVEFDVSVRAKARYAAMQSGEELPDLT